MKIEKQGLATTEEIINEEYTLRYGHVFRASNELELTHITYENLLALRNDGKLRQGGFYRITDYATMTTQANTRSAEHPFDIVVQALDKNTLSEDAHAIQRDGDEYFANSNLAAWKLRYLLDNDSAIYSWMPADIKEVEQKWVTSWGVLESRKDADASTNYRKVKVNGVTKYLYAPAERGTFLSGKEFYRMVGQKEYHFTSMDELVVGSLINPYDNEDGGTIKLYIIDKTTGDIIDELYGIDEMGDTEDDEGNYYYEVRFAHEGYDEGYEYDMVHGEGDTTTLNGQTYYIWFEYEALYGDESSDEGDEGDEGEGWSLRYTSSDSRYPKMRRDYLNKTITSGGTKEVYNGSLDKLYYAFDSILPSTSSQPKPQIYSAETGRIYKSDNWYDNVSWTAYTAPEVIGKGVICGMTDERGNYAPYDFKNIQFLYDGDYYYTFNMASNSSDASLTDLCHNNRINLLKRVYKTASEFKYSIPNVIFDTTQTTLNTSNAYGIYENIVDIEVKGVMYIHGRMGCNKWACQGSASLMAIGTFISGKDITQTLYGNTFYLGTTGSINNNVATSVIGNTIYIIGGTASCSISFHLQTLLFNTIKWIDSYSSSKSLVIGDIDNAKACSIQTSDITIWDGHSLVVKLNMAQSTIATYTNLTLTSANTTSSSSPITNLNIYMIGGRNSNTSVVVDANFKAKSSYKWHIAKNSSGTVKQWCDANLVG